MLMFKRNMSPLDRFLRGGIGVLCVYFGFVDISYIDQTLISTIVGLFGILNLISAFKGHCPVYKLAGINTCSEHNHT